MHSFGTNMQLNGCHSLEERRFYGRIENISDFVTLQSVAHHPFVTHPLATDFPPLTQCIGSFDQLVAHFAKH